MSGKSDGCSTLEENCKKMLKSTIFLGNYTERRWVPHMNRYKDVIVLSKSETELRGNLLKLRMDIHNNHESIKTSNIVIAPDFTVLYTILPFGCPFGNHWFKMKHVNIDPIEKDVIFKLKIVRSVGPNDFADLSKDEATKPTDDEAEMLWSDVMQRLQFALSVTNVVHCLRIALLAIMTVGMGAFIAVKSLAMFSLGFIREVSILIRSSTPLLLGVSNVIAKIFGAIFILISMVWKDLFYLARRKFDPEGTPAQGGNTVRPQVPALTFYNSSYNTPLSRNMAHYRQYTRHQSGVVITELPND
ncbi:uncharacterized protein LOC135945333 [Cloeon dipterum]|uniref:uncharacterized protein LOC135945333 n=1 Tax=Cloeon dipterum TaxID=197152 RepID=UPI00321FFF87